jgi:putative transposase
MHQCQILCISRSSLYYQPVSPSEEDLTLLQLIDQQYLSTQFYGSHRITAQLSRQGYVINRKRVQRLTGSLPVIYEKFTRIKLTGGAFEIEDFGQTVTGALT